MKDSHPKQIEKHRVGRIQEGDEEAFQGLFRSYYEELCSFVETQVGSPEVAEDLVQNIFMRLWRRRQEWEPNSSVRAYLFGAARNEAIKYRKHREVRHRWREEKKEEDTPDKPGPDDKFRHRRLEKALQQSVAELPERRRQAYVLSRWYGLTYKEIAEVMDISPKTVDNQMVKALKSLRKRLRPFLSTFA